MPGWAFVIFGFQKGAKGLVVGVVVKSLKGYFVGRAMKQKTFIEFECKQCSPGCIEVYEYSGNKDSLVCHICNGDNVAVQFVEWTGSDWKKIDPVNEPGDILRYFSHKMARGFDNINARPILEMAQDKCTPQEIYDSLDSAVKFMQDRVSDTFEHLKLTNHLLFIMQQTWSIANHFDGNVQVFLDEIIKDIARNPSSHKFYDKPLSHWLFSKFIHEYFPDLPEEYVESVSDFVANYHLSETIAHYEIRNLEPVSAQQREKHNPHRELH